MYFNTLGGVARTPGGARWGLLPILLALLLGACDRGGDGGGQLAPEQAAALESRVAARWAKMAAHDFAGVWQFQTPAYREIFPKELFVYNFSYAVDWELTGVEVVSYDAGAAVASVVARVMTRSTKLTSSSAFGSGAVPRDFRERWLLIDGEWWFGSTY